MTKAVAKKQAAPVAQSESTEIISLIERLATNPDVDIDRLERVMQMRVDEQNRQAEIEFNTAMNAAQEEMGPISQDASNPQTRSKYASYKQLDRALRPIYTRHGFNLRFGTADGAPEGEKRITCRTSHKSGYSELEHLDVPADGMGAKGNAVMTKTHAAMSAVSYGRRGLLKMIFNIAEGEFDDDGNAAGDTAEKISEAQIEELDAIAAEHGRDKIKYCKAHKISALAEIPAANFEKVKAEFKTGVAK